MTIINTRQIPVYKYGEVVAFATVDSEDYDKLMKYTWTLHNGYAYHRSRQFSVMMHRLVNDTEKGLMTDHINGIRLDNRKENLRTCTNSENQRNRNAPSNNTSGYKGVSKRSNNKWRAVMQHNGRWICLGTHDTKEEAAREYNKAAIKYHGEFAVLNRV